MIPSIGAKGCKDYEEFSFILVKSQDCHGQGWAKHPGTRDFPESTQVNFVKPEILGENYIVYFDERTSLSQTLTQKIFPLIIPGYPALLPGKFPFFEK